MLKTVTFSIDKYELKEINDSQFAKLRMYICHDLENKNASYISLDTMKEAEATLLNKPIIMKLNITGDDFKEHEIDTVPVGVVPETGHNIHYEEVAGRTYLVADAIIWKYYSSQTLAIFDRDTIKGVSMEIQVLDEHTRDDGFIQIDKYAYLAVCLLGDKYETGMYNTVSSIIQFSKSNDMNLLCEQWSAFTKAPKEDAETMEKEVDIVIQPEAKKDEDVKVETDTAVEETAVEESNKAEFSEEETKEELKTEEVKEESKEEEAKEEIKEESKEETKAEFSEEEAKEEPKEEAKEEVKAEEPKEEPKEETKEEFAKEETTDESNEEPEEDTEEMKCQDKKMSEDEEEEDEEDKNEDEDDKEEESKDEQSKDYSEESKAEFSKLQSEISEKNNNILMMSAKIQKLENENKTLQTSIEELQAFKTATEQANKEKYAQKLFSDLSNVLSKDDMDNWKEKISEYEDIDVFEKHIKSFACDKILSNKDVLNQAEFCKMDINVDTVKEDESDDSNTSVWARISKRVSK